MTRPIHVSDALRSQQPFYDRFQQVLHRAGSRSAYLNGATTNIWCRDYMPVGTRDGRLVKFRYWPDYLVRSRTYHHTLADASRTGVVEPQMTQVLSELIVDGGNVVLGPDYAILTRKVLHENPHYTKRRLIAELERLLGVGRIILIPWDPHDYTGHADGMVRVYDRDTVLVNDYRWSDPRLGHRVLRVLRDEGLRTVLVPYQPTAGGRAGSALGCYVNFLRHLGVMLIPTFGLPADGTALECFEELFPTHRVIPLDCRELAIQGGVLNCITWAPFPEWMSWEHTSQAA